MKAEVVGSACSTHGTYQKCGVQIFSCKNLKRTGVLEDISLGKKIMTRETLKQKNCEVVGWGSYSACLPDAGSLLRLLLNTDDRWEMLLRNVDGDIQRGNLASYARRRNTFGFENGNNICGFLKVWELIFQLGRTIAQAVSRWLHTAAPRVQTRV
jgi:hypothetical protein